MLSHKLTTFSGQPWAIFRFRLRQTLLQYYTSSTVPIDAQWQRDNGAAKSMVLGNPLVSCSVHVIVTNCTQWINKVRALRISIVLHIRRWIWAPPPSSGGNWSSLSDETCLENRTEYRFACRIFAKNERHELYLHRYYSLAKERRTAPTTILTVHKSEPS